MKLKALCLATTAALLGACGGEAGDKPTYENWQIGEVYYSYPYDGQQGVSPKTPLVLRFSHKVSIDDSNVTLLECPAADSCEGGVATPLQAPQAVDGGMGVVIQPALPLKTGSHYQLVLNGINTSNGQAQFPDGGMDFQTRLAVDGPLSAQMLSPDLAISKIIPNGDPLQFMDFSTLRLQFNQQLDEASLVYGDTDADASVELEGPNGTVPALLLVKGNAVTIDPGADLVAGKAYTLKLTDAVRGVSQDGLTGGFSQTWTAGDSMPRATLVQEVIPASSLAQDPCNDPQAVVAKLTGAAMNCVPIQSTLLGSKDATLQSGDVRAELAFLPNYPDVSPLRIARNSLLTGSNIQVKVGGEVAAGIETGAISVTFLSDASGYLLPNPYSDSHQAPKQVKLYMDVSMTAENPEANGALSQTLMHVELNGMALVNDGRMEIDAVGVVEPKVLGQETAFGLLSFHMESYEDQENAPALVPDMTAPVLQSMVPETNGSGIALTTRPGDVVALNFSEPLDPASLEHGSTFGLQQAGQYVPAAWRLDGATLVITPQTPLAFGENYDVVVTDQVTDLAGNALVPETRSFTMPSYLTDAARSPVVLTAMPGFPCIGTGMDLANDNAGRCAGGKNDDDFLPLSRLPENRDIVVTFSQQLDAATVNASTFVVEEVDSNGAALGAPLAGQRSVVGRKLTFTPEQPWTPGSLYRYTLKSVLDNPVCGSDAICSAQNPSLPLQTQMLAQNPDAAPDANQGGPNLPIYFRAVEAGSEVLQALRNFPTGDVNANFIIDAGETLPSQDPEVVRNSARAIANPANNPDNDGTAASGSGVKDANVGCDVGSSCPDKKYIYLTGDLNVEVSGFVAAADVDQADPTIPQYVKDNGGVQVFINPTRIVTSDLVVYTQLPDAIDLVADAPPASTGPQLMRIRYTCDPTTPGDCEAPAYGRVPGWIYNDGSGPVFVTQLNLYLDAPKLAPVVYTFGIPAELTHNQHSYPLSLQLAGDVTFLEDGRMQIEQISQNPLDINVVLGELPLGLTGEVFVTIPTGGNFLNYSSVPIQQ